MLPLSPSFPVINEDAYRAYQGASAVITGDIPPAAAIKTLLMLFMRTPHLNKKGTVSGQVFELVVLECLIRAGVPIERIRRNLDLCPPHKADVDILILPEKNGKAYALFLKTSWRERWKIIDRDAGLAKSCIEQQTRGRAKSLHTIGLHLSEYPNKKEWDSSRNMSSVADKFSQMTKVDDAISVFDVDALARLFDKIIRA